MAQQSNYILFYSNQCIHSKEFLNQLHQNKSLFDTFIKVDVNKPGVNIPKCVNAVPAIIIKSPNTKPLVYIGDEVFHWYNKTMSRLSNKKNAQNKQSEATSSMGNGTSSSIGSDVLDYDPCAMSGFSDGFAYLDDKVSKNSPLAHQFEFLGGQGGSLIGAGNQISLNQGGQIKESAQDKTELESRMEQLMAQRSRDTPQGPSRKGGETVV